jgi:ribosomal protein L30E
MLTMEEFEALPNKQKLTCLYQNQVKTIIMIKNQLAENNRKIENYQMYYKVAIWIMGFLSTGMGVLFFKVFS